MVRSYILLSNRIAPYLQHKASQKKMLEDSHNF